MVDMNTAPHPRIVVSKTLCHGKGGCHQQMHDSDDAQVLNLMMLCCEERAPYGPAEDTASMFLEVLCAAYDRCRGSVDTTVVDSASAEENKTRKFKKYTIRITVYHAKFMDYPETVQEWDSYHGIIIPGSLSSAYDTHVEWIHHLMTVVQQDIHEKQRKTLAICFGHQCFAHSFGLRGTFSRNDQQKSVANNVYDRQTQCGLATKCSTGPAAGRKTSQLTDDGKFLLRSISYHRDIKYHENNKAMQSPEECLEMLYTRGDMVKSLPPVGIALCGNGGLCNEACAYFASEEDVLQFQSHVKHQLLDLTPSRDVTTSKKQALHDKKIKLPYAITFQAHPEYLSPTGYKVNFVNTVRAMAENGTISQETAKMACEDANLHHDTLLCDSLDAIILAGVILGWFEQ